MTSNLGSQHIMEHATGSEEQMRDLVMEVLRQAFRPEFLNRIDEILIFNRLGREEISQIVQIQLGLVRDRVASQGFLLEWTPPGAGLPSRDGI